MRGLWLLALVLLAGCQHVAAPPVGGDIRDLHSGEMLTAQQLLERLAEPERLIIGEQHDNADHHAAQLWLLQALGEQRAQGSLLLEMLTPDQQAKVDAARQSKSVAADLPAALAWQEGWDWNLYGPIVRFALSQPYPLLAANLDDSEIRTFYRNPPALNGPRSNALPVRNTLLGQVRESHCGLLPESQMLAMLAIQQQRDRRMAERMLAAPIPTILLAGAWHARKDVGVPLHLSDLGAGKAPIVLMLAEQGAAVSAAMADYVWYTPATPKPDYCEQMRQQFAK